MEHRRTGAAEHRSRAKPQAIIFDAFGTLITFGQAHHPYRLLMQHLRTSGRRPQLDDARTILTFPGNLEALAEHLGASLTAEQLLDCEHALEADLQGIHIFPDVAEVMIRLRHAELRIGLCSNLAQAYGDRVVRLLPKMDSYSMSYDVGSIKPEPTIYEHALTRLRLPPASCIFVGDSAQADRDGACAAGMDGRLLDRSTGQGLFDVLEDILT